MPVGIRILLDDVFQLLMRVGSIEVITQDVSEPTPGVLRSIQLSAISRSRV